MMPEPQHVNVPAPAKPQPATPPELEEDCNYWDPWTRECELAEDCTCM